MRAEAQETGSTERLIRSAYRPSPALQQSDAQVHLGSTARASAAKRPACAPSANSAAKQLRFQPAAASAALSPLQEEATSPQAHGTPQATAKLPIAQPVAADTDRASAESSGSASSDHVDKPGYTRGPGGTIKSPGGTMRLPHIVRKFQRQKAVLPVPAPVAVVPLPDHQAKSAQARQGSQTAAQAAPPSAASSGSAAQQRRPHTISAAPAAFGAGGRQTGTTDAPGSDDRKAEVPPLRLTASFDVGSAAQARAPGASQHDEDKENSGATASAGAGSTALQALAPHPVQSRRASLPAEALQEPATARRRVFQSPRPDLDLPTPRGPAPRPPNPVHKLSVQRASALERAPVSNEDTTARAEQAEPWPTMDPQEDQSADASIGGPHRRHEPLVHKRRHAHTTVQPGLNGGRPNAAQATAAAADALQSSVAARQQQPAAEAAAPALAPAGGSSVLAARDGARAAGRRASVAMPSLISETQSSFMDPGPASLYRTGSSASLHHEAHESAGAGACGADHQADAAAASSAAPQAALTWHQPTTTATMVVSSRPKSQNGLPPSCATSPGRSLQDGDTLPFGDVVRTDMLLIG